MKPILKIVAREYAKRYPNLKDLCFIFPNKRCGIFLRKFFAEEGILTEDLPHILTISEFVGQVARKFEAGRIEQLFTLYKCYLELLNANTDEKNSVPVEFEDFRNWGETVLADFNTVDMYLADPKEIFRNVKDYRSITSNFLTDEQKEIMKEYFGVEDPGDPSTFWKLFNEEESLSSLKSSFLNLWQVMAPLHEKFVRSLALRGTASSGSLYRFAASKIEYKGREALPYKKIVAVGFNALTETERVIFKTLENEEGYEGYDDFIDFVWDAYGPVFESDSFTASKFINYNRKYFPSPEWLEKVLQKEAPKEWPKIEIISAPSNTSQAKVATKILQKYGSEVDPGMIRDAGVAMVLPDESLLSNVLFSIPDSVSDVNLTMGFSLRQTSIAAFYHLLKRVYATSREGREKNKTTFFAKDLKMLFSHPYIYRILPKENVQKLIDYIDSAHRVAVTFEVIKEKIPESENIFAFPPKKERDNSIFLYLLDLQQKLLDNFSDSPDSPDIQDISEIKIYGEYIDELHQALTQYSIEISPLGVMNLIGKLVSSSKITFEGEPLRGLQIMGTLETRVLDFTHIIILSMNEGIMPRRSYSASFIPESLRKAYGLPPAHYAEELFSYYFYRLISRAEKVSLIYDSLGASGNKGAESRYILQLKEYAPQESLSFSSWNFTLQNREKTDASIQKTPEIKRMTEVFCTSGAARHNLSASSLNTYRECQVKFFLKNILRLNDDPEPSEFMDAITIGNILHETMMDLYIQNTDQRKVLLKTPIKILPSQLQQILDNPQEIKKLVDQKVTKHYYKGQYSSDDAESGVTGLISRTICDLVEAILKYDKNLAPFNLYGCEIEQNIRIKLSSGRVINFRFAIDRLDEIFENGEWRLRVVDYKTGVQKRKAKDFDDIFSGNYYTEQLFQLFVYAWVLGKIGFKGWNDVITEIYYVPDLEKGERGLPEIAKKPVNSFSTFADDFNLKLEEMLESIFEGDMFKEASSESQCAYCTFKSYCGK